MEVKIEFPRGLSPSERIAAIEIIWRQLRYDHAIGQLADGNAILASIQQTDIEEVARYYE